VGYPEPISPTGLEEGETNIMSSCGAKKILNHFAACSLILVSPVAQLMLSSFDPIPLRGTVPKLASYTVA
jgi:hypothetical protein